MGMTEYRLLNVVKFTNNEVKAKRLEEQGYKKVEAKSVETVEESEEKEEPKAPAKKTTTKKEG